MPEPPREPRDEPPHDPPPPASSPRPDDEAERVLDEAFKLGEGEEAWLEIARRASRPAEPLGSLGPYSLLEEIGRGGQGEVYKAVQPGTGRVVALKRLAAGGLRIGSRAAERFSREVDAATRLSHPNVVTVYAAEVIDGHAVLVMEWIDGTIIDRWADACWADPSMNEHDKRARVLRAFAAACDGVAHAPSRRDPSRPEAVEHHDRGRRCASGAGLRSRKGPGGVGANTTRRARANGMDGDGVRGTPAMRRRSSCTRAAARWIRADVYAAGRDPLPAAER